MSHKNQISFKLVGEHQEEKEPKISGTLAEYLHIIEKNPDAAKLLISDFSML